MDGEKVAIKKKNSVFPVKVTLRYERNLQNAMDYSFQNWGVAAMIELYVQITKEIEKLILHPYNNEQNRFLDDVTYKEIDVPNYPYVITYRIYRANVKIINIVYTSRHPIRRKKEFDLFH